METLDKKETFLQATESLMQKSANAAETKPLPNIHIDKLKLYFRQPIVINAYKEMGLNDIVLLQPSIGDIVKVSEPLFYSTLSVFTTNPTANRLLLWNEGIDWNDLTDYGLFVMFFNRINPEISKLIFQDVDFTRFKRLKKNDDILFYNEEQNIVIDENIYNIISLYFRTMFNAFPKTEKTVDAVAKEWIIEEELMNAAIKKDEDKSSLFSLISTCVNHPGFKYKSSELINVGIFEFMDSVKRLQIYESATAVMKGMYSGFVDVKKIDKEAYNFMKES